MVTQSLQLKYTTREYFAVFRMALKLTGKVWPRCFYNNNNI